MQTHPNTPKHQIDALQPRIAKNNRLLLGRNTLATKHQDILRQLKNKVALYQSKARSLHKTILHLLEDDDDMHSLHLTRTMMHLMEEATTTTSSPPTPPPPKSSTTQPSTPPPAPDPTTGEPAGLFNYPPLSPERGRGGTGKNGGENGGGEAAAAAAAYDAAQQQQQQQQLAAAQAAVAAGANAAHAEAEELLESYLADLYEIIMKWELIRDDMQTTEEYVLMKLDMARNKLLTYGKHTPLSAAPVPVLYQRLFTMTPPCTLCITPHHTSRYDLRPGQHALRLRRRRHRRFRYGQNDRDRMRDLAYRLLQAF